MMQIVNQTTSPAERDATVQAALDYYEGWFDGNALRMHRALHPDLVKRALHEDGRRLNLTTAEGMIEATARGVGRSRDPGKERRGIEVEIEDVHQDIANVTVYSAVYVDYLQLARTRDGWKIVNVLWQGR
jgi:hypothetical protein